MEYIYGTDLDLEILKTVGDTHSALSGFIETRREYGDGTVITDRCHIVERFHSAEANGKCYDWYTIDQHYRVVTPATTRATEDVKTRVDELDEALEMILTGVTEDETGTESEDPAIHP